MSTKICENCKNEFTVPSWRKTQFLCSRKCKIKYSVGRKLKQEILKACLVCEKRFTVYPSLKRIKYCSRKCKGDASKGITGYWAGKKRESMKGGKNWAWKGGVTPINKLIRHSVEYKQWIKNIFKRDNYTCQICNIRGVELNADHIKPFVLFPELRLELSNGRTLCRKCHQQTDTWGGRVHKLRLT
ncbi:MAG: HNH endonuclease [Patescibacteria group bacterium]